MAGVLQTCEDADLDRITDPGVVAVIYEPRQLPGWMSDLVAAVESGKLVLPRIVLPDCSRDELDTWLDRNLPPLPVADCLREDVLMLAGRLQAITQASRLMVRMFAAAPNSECGFHIDTTAAGVPPWGLLRVYGGIGTTYVEPSNVLGMDRFYYYLKKRERLARERHDARQPGGLDVERTITEEILRLDEQRDFLVDPSAVHSTPPGAIVAFKHLDQQLHWSGHDATRAWIHCSPMQGSRRLVVNVTAAGRQSRLPA